MKIYFDPNNKNCLIIEEVINNKINKHHIAIPNGKNRTDLIDLGNRVNFTGYFTGFDGLILFTDENSRTVFYKNKEVCKINF